VDYRRLGQTNLDVSVLGFGASPLGNVFRKTSFKQNQDAVDAAIDAGINFFDVSPYYGETLAEERLGRTLAGKRDRVVLATKCGRYGVNDFDFSRARIRRSLEESLGRLRTTHIDLFQAHDIEFAHQSQILEEALPAMRELQAEGKVRFIGITGYPVSLLRTIARVEKVDTILSYCRFTLLNSDMDAILSQFTREEGIGLINASPLMMGLLTKIGPPVWHPASRELKEASRRAVSEAERRGISIEALSIGFAVANQAVATTLVGMATADEVIKNIQAVKDAISVETIKELQVAAGGGFATTWPSGLEENSDESTKSRSMSFSRSLAAE
jgi:L-galactose dehydrogenase